MVKKVLYVLYVTKDEQSSSSHIRHAYALCYSAVTPFCLVGMFQQLSVFRLCVFVDK